MAAFLAVREAEHEHQRRTRQRSFVNRIDPHLCDHNVVQEYRLNTTGIEFLCNLVGRSLVHPTNRSMAITVQNQVLIALKLLGSGSFQRMSKDFVGVSQSSVSRCLDRFLDAILLHSRDFIYMPQTAAAIIHSKRKFFDIKNFPGVIGAIDGTQVPMIAPHVNEHSYVCRKGYHSLNVQAICDADMLFIDVVARWPGANHDSFIVQNSLIADRFSTGEFGDSLLLGDSGYALYEWLMTPIKQPQNAKERAYNRSHKKTRALVERSFGILKMRWRILDQTGGHLCYQPQKVAKIVMACCILHNLCRRMKIPTPDNFNIEDEENHDEEDDSVGQDRISGLSKRAQIVDTFAS